MQTNSEQPGQQQTATFAGGLLKQSRLVWRLLRDSRVSEWLKLIPLVGLIYLLSPIDLIPDLMLPGLGELDDLVIIMLSLKAFVDLSPAAVVREHMDNLTGKQAHSDTLEGQSTEPYIDAAYRIIGKDEK
jgi:uncharacterized membrane protein YkvA (DUF1232 family)